MLNDFTPIIRDFEGDIKIYPVFDTHFGAAEFNEKAWIAFCNYVNEQPNAYIVVGGDILNNGTKNSVTNVYEEAMRPREQKAYAVEQLSRFNKGKILCGVPGNHENRSAKEVDDNPLYDVFAKLDLEDVYRDNAAFLILRLSNKSFEQRQKQSGYLRPTYTALITHGSGGGMYIGSTGNKLERFGTVFDGLDVLFTGHTHKPLAFPVGKIKIDPQNGKITPKQFTVVQATGWLGFNGYPVRKLMTPAAFAIQEVSLSSCGKKVSVTF